MVNSSPLQLVHIVSSLAGLLTIERFLPSIVLLLSLYGKGLRAYCRRLFDVSSFLIFRFWLSLVRCISLSFYKGKE